MNVRHIAARGTAKLSLLLAGTAALCFGQIWPGDSGYAAKVIEESGQVSVLKDSTPWALNVGDEIQVRQLIITGWDGQARFKVSDGSTFDVYPNSRVVFRKAGTPNWRDLLDVLVGRVRVHIEHLYGPNPNRVLTPTAVISVRGTTFDITVDDDDESTTVEVEEGLVEVQHALLPRGNSKMLTTGETFHVYRNVPIASNRVDKGELAKRVMRAAVDAISTWESRIPRGTAGGSTGIGSGDTGKKLPPPPVATAPAAPPVAAPPPPPAHFTESSGANISVFVVHRPQPETRIQKIKRAVINAVERFLLGPEPGLDVIRALQK